MSKEPFYEPETLVDRLHGIYRIPIKDGLGPVGGDNEEPESDNYVRTFDMSSHMPQTPIMREAARRIKELEAQVLGLGGQP